MGAEAGKSREEEEAETNIRMLPSLPNPNPNSITQAQFLAWKSRKDADASAKKAEAARKRAEDIAAGVVQMNGRELFAHEPWVFDNTQY
ncbi:uncharacterized protein LOC127246524 [Andrographis paniculata]|uniref:uncharacterized protein LOC127246524 n=1 Tax=Andrographis paniculata TaxID=175694 RepID=UPI0021E74B95|nr:uncharacterized protein LOC127246524 [Andrographis paniculata]